MNPDSLAAAHQRAVAASARFRLPLRSRVWKGQAGEFLGAGIGSSLDFQDHRAYSPGDDPRHINWAAYARTGHYTMKLYREEARPVVDLIVDASESMFVDEAKTTRTAELLVLLAESTRRAGASLSLHLVRGEAVLRLDPESLATHQWLDAARQLAPSDAAAPPHLGRVPLRANALRVFLSDLLFPANPEPLLQLLAARQGSPFLLAPFTQAEAHPEWSGNYEFIDAETQGRHPRRVEPGTLRRYLDAYRHHFALWKNACLRHQARLARVAAEPDLATALFADAVPAGVLELTR